ncbi:MAG: ParB/RepB/Spo0J family partition protein [Eubacteriaceae bacterium]|nr:ParB/RepB/Spo0J family partition protein [Eubacteriaceae bacterium]
MKNNQALGRGLDALIPFYAEDVQSEDAKSDSSEVEINLLVANSAQPRKIFDDEKIEELSESIKTHGVLQPLIVVPQNNGKYKIVAGERRWRAATKAGLKTVPVIIKNYSEQEVLAISLVENLQRQDLHDIEKAHTYQKLIEEFSLTHDSLASVLGISRTAVTNTLRLLSLTDTEQDALLKNKISSGHARALLSLPEGKMRSNALEAIIKNTLSVREAEKLVKNISSPKVIKNAVLKDVHIIQLETELTEAVGNKVIINESEGKGKIIIEYYNKSDRDRLVEELRLLSEKENRG